MMIIIGLILLSPTYVLIWDNFLYIIRHIINKPMLIKFV